MADKIYVGTRAQRFEVSPRFPGYDMVILNIDDKNYVSSPYVTIDTTKWTSRTDGTHVFVYHAASARWQYNNLLITTAALSSTYGLAVVLTSVTALKDDDTITVEKTTTDGVVSAVATLSRSGHVLEGNCPLVKASQRQTVADNLLAKVYGHEYQPYRGENIRISPAAELGDAITAFGVYGGIYDMETTLGRLVHASMSAPADEEVDYEFQFKSSQERRYQRRFAELESEFTIQADLISAKVSKTGGGTSFGWELEEDHFSILSNGNTVFKIDNDEAYFQGIVRADQIIAGTVTVGGVQINAGYIQGSQIGEYTIRGGVGGNIGAGTIIGGNVDTYTLTGGTDGNLATSTVVYGNTAFTSTLDQVSTNASNISALSGYFNSTYANRVNAAKAYVRDELYYQAQLVRIYTVKDTSGSNRGVLGLY